MDCALAILCGPGVDHAPLLEQSAEVWSRFDEIFVVAPALGLHLGTGLRLVADLFPGGGVLAGIHAALVASRCEQIVALTGKQPLPAPAIVGALIDRHRQARVVLLEREGALSPLPGRYHRGCLKRLRLALLQGRTDPAPLLDEMHPTRVEHPMAGTGR